jgi:hypothetical protein
MRLNPLRVPERLFAVAMWVVSLVFASFLIGLGGKIVGDLPGIDQRLTLDNFVDQARDDVLETRADSLRGDMADREAERERATLAVTAADNTYGAARESFENWIATRTATTDPQQDPEVVTRTRALDELRAASRAREQELEAVDVALLRARQELRQVEAEQAELRVEAQGAFDRALFRHELEIFGIRLALTLPLLLLAGWLVARKRRSDYWPLYRGVVLFGVFAFFVELVPYLPSYGGYVRYGVGIVASAIVGHFVIRAMRRYLERRQEAAQRTEAERRSALGYEEALKRIGDGVCPGCERAIAVGPNGPSNYCVHCGMMLFDQCRACDTRKNAFFQFCPACGTVADPAETGAATA